MFNIPLLILKQLKETMNNLFYLHDLGFSVNNLLVWVAIGDRDSKFEHLWVETNQHKTLDR